MRAVNLGTTMNRGEGGDAAQADDGQPEDWGPDETDKFMSEVHTMAIVQP